MLHLLIGIAGFVVFLCVFGMRGLMVTGAVAAALYGFVVLSDYQDIRRNQQRDAEIAAECKTILAKPEPSPGDFSDDVMRFVCGPAPVATARR